MNAAALEFIVDQTKRNVEFLVSQGVLPKIDGDHFIQKLDLSRQVSRPSQQLLESKQNSVEAPAPSSKEEALPDPPVYSEKTAVTTESNFTVKAKVGRSFSAKALWAYNENNESDDLSFRAGDTIEVIEETSAEWWTGMCRGREGLFPSNYVEKLTRTPSPLPPPAPRNNSIRSSYHDYGYDQRGPSPSFPTPDQSSPYSAAPSFHQSPYPPMAQGYPGPYYTPPQHQAYGYGGPPPSTPIPGPSTSQPQQPEQPPKKHKLGGKLGSTLAHSAAGGVGFGAGSAIGSGIIHSIF